MNGEKGIENTCPGGLGIDLRKQDLIDETAAPLSCKITVLYRISAQKDAIDQQCRNYGSQSLVSFCPDPDIEVNGCNISWLWLSDFFTGIG